MGEVAMVGEDQSVVCIPVGTELEFTEPMRWACSAVIRPGYRLARTFVDEAENQAENAAAIAALAATMTDASMIHGIAVEAMKVLGESYN
jgi:hypothetical protein